MPRYSGPVSVRILGDQAVGAKYIGLARTVLGEQMAIHVGAYESSRGLASRSAISQTYTPRPTEYIKRRVSLPNGVRISVEHNTYMPRIAIQVPEGAEVPSVGAYRPLWLPEGWWFSEGREFAPNSVHAHVIVNRYVNNLYHDAPWRGYRARDERNFWAPIAHTNAPFDRPGILNAVGNAVGSLGLEQESTEWRAHRPELVQLTANQQTMLDLVNGLRTDEGELPLTGPYRGQHSPALTVSRELALAGIFAHDSNEFREGYKTFLERATRDGWAFTVALENIAENIPDTTDLFEAWRASPGHRANMVNALLSPVDGDRSTGILHFDRYSGKAAQVFYNRNQWVAAGNRYWTSPDGDTVSWNGSPKYAVNALTSIRDMGGQPYVNFKGRAFLAPGIVVGAACAWLRVPSPETEYTSYAALDDDNSTMQFCILAAYLMHDLTAYDGERDSTSDWPSGVADDPDAAELELGYTPLYSYLGMESAFNEPTWRRLNGFLVGIATPISEVVFSASTSRAVFAYNMLSPDAYSASNPRQPDIESIDQRAWLRRFCVLDVYADTYEITGSDGTYSSNYTGTVQSTDELPENDSIDLAHTVAGAPVIPVFADFDAEEGVVYAFLRIDIDLSYRWRTTHSYDAGTGSRDLVHEHLESVHHIKQTLIFPSDNEFVVHERELTDQHTTSPKNLVRSFLSLDIISEQKLYIEGDFSFTSTHEGSALTYQCDGRRSLWLTTVSPEYPDGLDEQVFSYDDFPFEFVATSFGPEPPTDSSRYIVGDRQLGKIPSSTAVVSGVPLHLSVYQSVNSLASGSAGKVLVDGVVPVTFGFVDNSVVEYQYARTLGGDSTDRTGLLISAATFFENVNDPVAGIFPVASVAIGDIYRYKDEWLAPSRNISAFTLPTTKARWSASFDVESVVGHELDDDLYPLGLL